jgi:replicative DNA helicase
VNIEMQQPHSDEAEGAVLGSLLIDQDAIYEVSDVLTADMFYRLANRWLYEALAALHARQQVLDPIAVCDELRKAGKLDEIGGMDYVLDLLNAVPTSLHVAAYAAIVAEKATRRRLLTTASAIAKAAYDETAPVDDALLAAETGIIEARGGGKSTVMTPHGFTSSYIDEFMRNVEAGEQIRGLSTGLVDIDAILGGLSAPNQYVIAGRTSMGKSSFALGVVLDAILHQRKRVMLFSLEMGQRQLVGRLVSMMTALPLNRVLREWTLSDHERKQVMEAVGELSETRLFIDCSAGIKPSDVRARATRIYMEHGLDMIAVDHMHIMRPEKQTANRVLDLGSISMELAEIYKTLNVVGLTMAQLSRGPEQRASKKPMLSDLRESGQIEENAYAVISLYREHYYDPTADPHIAVADVLKHRDGPTGQASLYWNPELAVFKNLTTHTIDLNPPRSNGHSNGHTNGYARGPVAVGEILL